MLQFAPGVLQITLVSNTGRRDDLGRKRVILHENMTIPEGISSKIDLHVLPK